ncbi:hypothetical protein TPELB_23780 [Terrisporobacter petrolearius]|uniref:Uncharacterized protein n=1 Tax=Terrisporobacter petrolearius TaxID=1460447 RepID=A0ABZ3FE69_9FIRM
MMTSVEICPTCGNKEEHKSDKNIEVFIDGFEDKNYFMECICSVCSTRFLVDIDSTLY